MKHARQRLLVSVRGPAEAVTAARGGSAIIDVEYPASALGTPYPLNIHAVRRRLDSAGYARLRMSTNIGERQLVRSTACQAAVGVATAGADLIKFGLAEMTLHAATYLGLSIIRSVRQWFPRKRLYPAVFADEDMCRFFNPARDGPKLAKAIHASGLLVDTFDKTAGTGLLDYSSARDLRRLCRALHDGGHELWVAGSIELDELPAVWECGVDVVCVRGAVCAPATGSGRFGQISETLVREFVRTIPNPPGVRR